MPKPIKLHLGCYHRKIHGFINIDARKEANPDIVDDARLLKKFKKNSIDLIYACHLCEHFSRQESFVVFNRWFELLKPGGILRISVPDLRALFEYYIKTNDLKAIENLLYGSQKHKYDFHYTGWDEKSLKETLESVGFTNIYRYDWRETEHFYVDDYSQCYLPSMEYKSRRITDEIKGTLVSLNIEATKALPT